MKTRLLPLLVLSLTLPALSQSAPAQGTSRIGEYTVQFNPGKFRAEMLSATKLRGVLTATGSGVVRISTTDRDIRAAKIIMDAEQRDPKKQTLLTEAALTGKVYVHLVQRAKDGTKYVYTVTCDNAIFKAGPKPKTGRLDFSGNAHLVADTPMTDLDLDCARGSLDLGDPDDLTKPPVLELLDGGTTGTVKPPVEKKKK